MTYVSGLTPAVMDAAAASATTHLCPELAGRVSPDERLKADAEHRRADAAIDKEEAAAAKLTAARAKRDAQEQEDR